MEWRQGLVAISIELADNADYRFAHSPGELDRCDFGPGVLDP